MATSAARLLPVLVPVVLLGLAACGGSDPEPAADGTTSAVGFTVEEGITPDDLLDCLDAAGLPVAATDSTPMGVEVPVEGLEVGPLAENAADGSEQGADLWVFTSPSAAAENRVVITLSEEDTPTSWVAGNVVVRLFYPPPAEDPQVESLRGCLPG